MASFSLASQTETPAQFCEETSLFEICYDMNKVSVWAENFTLVWGTWFRSGIWTPLYQIKAYRADYQTIPRILK